MTIRVRGIKTLGMIPLPIIVSPPNPGKWFLRADLEDAPNQSISNNQILNTKSEGVEKGKLTAHNTDGNDVTVKSNWYELDPPVVLGGSALVSEDFDKELGRTFFWKTKNTDTLGTARSGWYVNPSLTTNVEIYNVQQNLNWFEWVVEDGAGFEMETTGEWISVGNLGDIHRHAIVLGGYNSDGIAWYPGASVNDFKYGASYFLSAQGWGGWLNMWRTRRYNTSPLYCGVASNVNNWNVKNLRVPKTKLADLLIPYSVDSFTDSNGKQLSDHTPDYPSTAAWTSSSMTIQGNRAWTNTAWGVAEINTGQADGWIEVDCTPAGSGLNFNVTYVEFRYSGVGDNRWYFYLDPSANEIGIWKVENGGWSRIIWKAKTINGGQTYKVRIYLNGNNIKVWVDNDEANILSISNAFNNTATRHGIRHYLGGAGAGGAYFDKWCFSPVFSTTWNVLLNTYLE